MSNSDNNAVMPKRVIDLTGMRFERLIVVDYLGGKKRHKWLCRCDCGAEKAVVGDDLKSGNTKSCGFYRTDNLVRHNKKHGKTQTREYSSWGSMRERCLNVRNKAYPGYGGRGITICERWDNFENFLADMGECPNGYSIDRIDNSGNYEPSNCRWADSKTQNRNKRNVHLITYGGETMSIGEWADRLGVQPSTLYARICVSGWTIETAITKPVRKWPNRLLENN